MSAKEHIIDIDRIVLTGADMLNHDQLNVLIEAELLRALSMSDLWASTGVADSETRVAREVARTVVRSVRGESDGA